jgi:regulator of RNase E activity RraB
LLACKGESRRPADPPAAPLPSSTATASATEHSPAPDEWNFYPGRINDAPASVMLNFWYGDKAPIAEFEHLLWVFIEMTSPGPHGLGLEQENAATGALEDALAAHIQEQLRVHYVGRIRGEGTWQLYFYGRTPDGLAEAVDTVMKQHPGRTYETGSKADPDWKFFHTVIFPDDERLQWIGDHAVVQSLTEHGDPLTEPRRVDHWIYFRDTTARDRFEVAAHAAGFATQEGSKTTSDDGQLGIQVYRIHHVDIDRIHATVMELHELASKHGGDYDGWETPVLKPED